MQDVSFNNRQLFDVGPQRFIQNIDQKARVSSITTTVGGGRSATSRQHFEYPLSIDINEKVGSSQGSQTVAIDQRWMSHSQSRSIDGDSTSSDIENEVTPTDTLLFNPNSGAITGNQNQSGLQRYRYRDSEGNCYDRQITSASGAATAVQDRCD